MLLQIQYIYILLLFIIISKLEIINGKLSGKVIPPIVDGKLKAHLLELISKLENIPLQLVF